MVYITPDKCVYGRPDGAYRTEYNDVMWDYFLSLNGMVRPIFNTLDETVLAAIEMATREQ